MKKSEDLIIILSSLLVFPVLLPFVLLKEMASYTWYLLCRFVHFVYQIINPKLSRKRKEELDLYISVALAFKSMLSDIAHGIKEADEILPILNRIVLDDNCHIGYRPVNYSNGESGDNANLYWYEGNEWENGRESRHSDRCIYRLLAPEIKSPQNTVFSHLSVEKSELGVWQVYLLSISSTMLPAFWHGNYFTRFIILSKDDVKQIRPEGKGSIRVWADVSPKVWIKEDMAFVSCCYWNDWDGVVRETIAFKYEENHITRIEMMKEKKLYRYHNPVLL